MIKYNYFFILIHFNGSGMHSIYLIFILGPESPVCARVWPDSGQIWPDSGQIRPDSGQNLARKIF
jgi:hypothetical protein